MPPSTATREPARQLFISAALNHRPNVAKLECQALFTLGDTYQLIERQFQRDLAHSGLTENGFLLLALLMERAPDTLTPSALADELHMGRPAITVTLDRLEISGLIRRERSTTDRRSLVVRITEKGRSTFETATVVCIESLAQLMADIPSQELEQLNATCLRLSQRFSDKAN